MWYPYHWQKRVWVPQPTVHVALDARAVCADVVVVPRHVVGRSISEEMSWICQKRVRAVQFKHLSIVDLQLEGAAVIELYAVVHRLVSHVICGLWLGAKHAEGQSSIEIQ